MNITGFVETFLENCSSMLMQELAEDVSTMTAYYKTDHLWELKHELELDRGVSGIFIKSIQDEKRELLTCCFTRLFIEVIIAPLYSAVCIYFSQKCRFLLHIINVVQHFTL